ncbi:hypothetical protein [Pararhizobium sp. PWRC1-1]|uniref:hypothetical protein n=1 Tax=Pararhizobium sp. PWRC1-1 TaxID=2804566 RepID=UPI003CF3BA2D
MMTYYLFSALALLAIAWFIRAAVRGHQRAMAERHRLLDEAHDLLREPGMTLAPDQFPVVTGHIADGRRVRIELIADTLVTRRLPQLWLKATLIESEPLVRPAIGALARPTGSEYYSLVHGLPEWMTPPKTGISLLMRGDGCATREHESLFGDHVQRLFADPRVKEAVITPTIARIVYQASQGGRAAHMFLRQAQFSLETVPAETIKQAIALAESLSAVLSGAERSSASKAA